MPVALRSPGQICSEILIEDQDFAGMFENGPTGGELQFLQSKLASYTSIQRKTVR